ncbi:MAG: hypothetical protein F6K65_40320 [Moorea sp. SIO3C2]|nr:hypothetical protein [Moorena sp. SIO3C2]
MQRPVGVTILAIIDAIQALLLTLLGLSTLFLGQVVVAEMRAEPDMSDLFEQLPPDFPELLPKLIAGVFFAIALANVLIAAGLWLLHTWAWYLNLVLQAIGIFGNLGGVLLVNPVSIAAVVFSSFYIYYFFRRSVQIAFRVRSAV